ncbi:DEAD/DEAH box helicase [Enterococcus cecorum]|uniref:DEAD-box ATP-dependent RNA helicase CshB n=2 Tax=Enterococcus cecorum TaxID=44008 RepID=S1RJM2_9ENTE|nr:DEAD/DEAH box helicase [Enterococcus cecorum]EOX18135.1 DEAD/DEAH box helicase [Enterococcus cecorum DSM 20682 = ATCC 43198]ESK62266.1 DEAD/DEAH box helicase [Enterococcus cecorum DSM 20682 = ATCC 43198]KLO73864.1 DEAD/DEAH box helicase [Enterococcus cecorum]MCJ0581290.1 DEAD/DEAH box helicase [Enterococcus cecorum]MDZ5574498.1 DEAD/DEAH box helicase [Enterococcus cecorum]
MSFAAFQLQDYLLTAIADKGFKQPTEVQERLIPVIQAGRSVVGQSQTGTGKTHTFLLPIFNQLDSEQQNVQAVITAPSRELATQIYQAAKQLADFSGEEISIINFVGGTDKLRQVERLATKQPHIVIGTPGRILDLVTSGDLLIHTTQVMVVDEADMTLDLGFLADVDQIAGRMPDNLQMLVFSATIPEKLRPFLRKYMNNPLIEEIKPKTVISETIDNWLISTKGKDVNQIIYQLLTIGHPYLAIVFANTKQRVDEISQYLKNQGLSVATIHGDILPRERKRVMKQIQNLDFQYVVATDLAARGIDIEGVSHVINAEIPDDLEFFIHRVGRTGRNQLPGTAITLYEPSDERKINEIEALGITFKPKEIKNDEVIDSYDRNRRQKREKKRDELDTTLIGLVKKKKKKIKPGYKKQIQREIEKSNKQKRKMERRQKGRTARKHKKNSSI